MLHRLWGVSLAQLHCDCPWSSATLHPCTVVLFVAAPPRQLLHDTETQGKGCTAYSQLLLLQRCNAHPATQLSCHARASSMPGWQGTGACNAQHKQQVVCNTTKAVVALQQGCVVLTWPVRMATPALLMLTHACGAPCHAPRWDCMRLTRSNLGVEQDAQAMHGIRPS